MGNVDLRFQLARTIERVEQGESLADINRATARARALVDAQTDLAEAACQLAQAAALLGRERNPMRVEEVVRRGLAWEAAYDREEKLRTR